MFNSVESKVKHNMNKFKTTDQKSTRDNLDVLIEKVESELKELDNK